MTDAPLRKDGAFGRYAVGIDLGTTNCAVCYVDMEAPDASVLSFRIPQLTGAGELGSEALLPSFCYLPRAGELPDGALELPWDRRPAFAVGRFAREQGALVPDELVFSAKSWLAHPGVNRRGNILPWGSELGARMLSPLQASCLYLDHIRKAWNHVHAADRDADGSPCLLEEQTVIVTVPASFDETARSLTLEAARKAGFRHLTLLEEPLAAFYSWLYRQGDDRANEAGPGSRILVVDVGGGTTDLSLVDVEEGGELRRTQVGEHILLGGDNMDMALARQAESAWNTRLPQRQWTQLCQECRRLKERLLAPDAPDTAQLRLAGAGSSLFAAARTHVLSRQQVLETILEGFFPKLPVDAAAPERRRGVQVMGLPYALEPAVTRHILHFLRGAGGLASPTHVLFNGGAMLPALLRERVLDAIGDWCGRRPKELASFDLSLAVAEGAACYALARAGRMTRVRGGIARAYYLEVGDGDASRLVCVMPRDTAEGVECSLPQGLFTLQTNTPVVFPLYASATRLGDKLGDFIGRNDEVTALPPLTSALKYGGSGVQTRIPVGISARLEETGVLALWCASKDTGCRYPLEFDLRGSAENHKAEVTLDETTQAALWHAVAESFTARGQGNGLMRRMEALTGLPRTEWNSVMLRRLADYLLENRSWRERNPENESRWTNLMGFCMRPGMGVAGDEWRVKELWKLWFGGPVHPRNEEVLCQWYILWRRIACGLKAGQQDQFTGELAKRMLGGNGELLIRLDEQSSMEMLRAVSAMERAPHARKLKLTAALLQKGGRLSDAVFWSIARLGARKPLLAGADAVVPASKWSPCVDRLLERVRQAGGTRMALFALASTCRLTEQRTLDLPLEQRQRVATELKRLGAPDEWTKMPLERVEDASVLETETLGDALPLGISLNTVSEGTGQER